MPLIASKVLVNGIEPAPVLSAEHFAAVAAARPIAGQELPPDTTTKRVVHQHNGPKHIVRDSPKSSKYMQDLLNNQ